MDTPETNVAATPPAGAPKRSFAEAVKDAGMLLATPFISVVYMAMFPFFFLAMLFGIGGLSTRRR